jgi:flagellar hook-associated protein 1 FlgK
VAVLGYSQTRDLLIEARLTTQMSASGFAAGKFTSLDSIGGLFDDLDGQGLQTAMGHFFSALEELSSDPTNGALRKQVLSAGGALVDAFHSASGSLLETRLAIAKDIKNELEEVNEQLARLAELNRQISEIEGGGAIAASLRDERQSLVQAVAAAVGAKPFESDDGAVGLALPGGGVLVDGHTAWTLETTISPAGVPTITLANEQGIKADLAAPLGGKIGGLYDAAAVQFQKYADKLDGIAYEFASAFNEQHKAGFGLDGVGGRDFFDAPAQAAGGAAAIVLSDDVYGNPDAIGAASSAALAGGDNTNLLSLVAMDEDASLWGGSETFSGGLKSLAQDVATDISAAKLESQAQEAVQAQMEEYRQSVSGVSVEEEMVALTEAQTAFEASAKVIEAADRMLETLVAMVR